MKPLVCLYCEGRETKVAVLAHEKGKFKVLAAESLDIFKHSPAGVEHAGRGPDTPDLGMDISLDNMGIMQSPEDNSLDGTQQSLLNKALKGINLKNCDFIPIVTEPAVNYHIYEGVRESNYQKQLDLIVNDINAAKNASVSKDTVGFVELADKSLLTAYLDGDSSCINLINSVAKYNGRRYYKIPTLKSAEISLAYYAAKTTKLFPEDFTLILYTGKEYSKLIFLEGQKLKHIGTLLDIGTHNLNTYDVYFSKVLLEMENGGIPRLDNIILCGEDNSENLILSFYGTFPEANVSQLKFEDVNFSALKGEKAERISAFSIPLAAAVDYFDNLNRVHKGLSILPNNIRENQRYLQFGWHSYAMLPVLFAATFFFTLKILTNSKQIGNMDTEIKRLTQLQIQNQEILDRMDQYTVRINSFDQTQALLDSASTGTDIWNKMFYRLSNYIETKGNFWISALNNNEMSSIISISGFSLSRDVLVNFADFNNLSLLQNIIFEPLREKEAYKFNLKFDFSNEQDIKNESQN